MGDNNNSELKGLTDDEPKNNIKCPETTCGREISIINFGKHLALEHFLLKMINISPKMIDNFKINTNKYRWRERQCVRLFMVKDKINNSGCHIWNQHIPMVLMCLPITLCDINGQTKFGEAKSRTYLMFWLTGYVTKNIPPISVQILFGHQEFFIRKSINVYACDQSQEPINVYHSGCAILLTSDDIRQLYTIHTQLIDVKVMID